MEKLPRASDLLKRSWAKFTGQWKLYVGISLIPAAFVLALAVGGGLVALAGLAIGALAGGGAGIELAGIGLFLALVLVALAVAIVVGIWSQVALAATVLKDDAPSIKEAYGRTKHLIRPYFWTSILTALVVILGFLLLIVPGIIFSLWYSMISFIVVGEGLRGTAAMKRSKFYIEGYLGEVFLKYLYVGAIWFAAWLALGLGLAWILGSQAAADIALQVLGILVGPLWVIYSALIYEELKARKALPAAAEPSEPAPANAPVA